MRAVVHYHNKLQESLNVSAGPRRVKRVRDTSHTAMGGPVGSSYTVYDNPSKIGEPPHKRTGNLQRNVKYELDKKNGVARIGVTPSALYGIFHELNGREWLLSTLRKELPAMRVLLSATR